MSDKKTVALLGGFSDPAFITTDKDEKKTDPYIKAEVIPSRYTGSNFKVGRPKKGHGKDVYFSKEYPTMASTVQNNGKEDKYVDPGKADRLAAQERKKKNIDQARDFKYASPPKRSTGPGSFFGTFDGKPIPHKEEYKVPPRGEPTAKKEIKTMKNILTSPARKGTYGYIGVTFSKFEGPEKADAYNAVRAKELEDWKTSKTKMIGNGVFKNTVRSNRTFDEKGATGISAAYDAYDAPEEKKAGKKKAAKPADDKSKIEGRPVFRYSSAPRSGAAGCLNPFPNTYDKPDPEDAGKLKTKADKEKAASAFIGGTWKPVSGAKQSVVRSLLKTYY